MEPANSRFGGGLSETALHPLVALVLLIIIGLIIFKPRHQLLAPLVFSALLIPVGQVVVIGGLHFTVWRIIGLFGLVRLALSGSLPNGVTPIDKALFLWALCYSVAFVILYDNMPAVLNRLGFLLDVAGGYLPFRFLIRDEQTVRKTIQVLAQVALAIAVVMLVEQITLHNIVGYLGGVASVPEFRDGTVRSHGVFQHALLAGTFGGTLIPLFCGIWPTARKSALLGILSATAIALTAHSSTPLLAYVGGVVALCFWPLRGHMRAFRWLLVIVLTSIHVSMKAPVWALISRVDLTGSSSGYHRYMLVDNLVRHFDNWWLLGSKDYNTWGWDMWDLCNQYVAYGLSGGLAALIFFILIISRGFGSLGTARKLARNCREREWLIWSLGAALCSHVVGYFGISYFDQTEVGWFILIAMICAIAYQPVQPEPGEELNCSEEAWLAPELEPDIVC